MMLKIGDQVQLCGNPFDEQIPDQFLLYMFIKGKILTITRVAKPGDLFAPYTEEPKEGQHWVKTDLTPDWIDAAWFVKL